MATKQFLTLEGLTTYDGLIKQYIGTEDAKSIKSLTVSGNTVSFYKTADASGTAAYTVNMPDVSGFMEKISSANGDYIVVSNDDGSVRESDKTLADIHDSIDSAYTTGYEAKTSAESALNKIGDGFDIDHTIADAIDAISDDLADKMDKGSWNEGGHLVTTNSNGELSYLNSTFGQYPASQDEVYVFTGYSSSLPDEDNIPIFGNTRSTTGGMLQDSGISINDIATQTDLADKIDKIASATGGKITVSDANGGVVESALTVADVTGKIDKIASATGGKLVTSTSAGQVAESGTAISDLATQSDIASFLTGYNYTNSQDKILISHGDPTEGDIEVSTVDIDDIATQTDLSGKMSKGPWNNSTGRIVLTAENGEVHYGSIFGKADSDQIFALTGYGYTPVPGNILIFDTPTNGGLVEDSGVALSDLATKAFVGSIPQSATATTVVGYVDEAVAEAGDDAEITLVEAQTPTTGYLKTYELYQGGNAAANLVGKIDIPKDLVVTSGEIVVNPTGQPAGTYLKLTIANQTAPVYINVADLVDAYTAASGATQVQLAISATNEISATLVAGGVGTTELASNAVTTAKIADDAVTADKVAISAHTEAQTAGSDGVAISVTTTDGQVSAVSASIAANTYDTYGAASGVQTSLVGTSSDPASADTINGAKAYADAATASIPTASIEALFA